MDLICEKHTVTNINETVLTRCISPYNSVFISNIFLSQISTSVRPKKPTALTAATTLWARSLVFAALPMSWDLMENSVTVGSHPLVSVLLYAYI